MVVSPNILWKSYKSVNITIIKKKPFDNRHKKCYIYVEHGNDEEMYRYVMRREGAAGESSCNRPVCTASELLP